MCTCPECRRRPVPADVDRAEQRIGADDELRSGYAFRSWSSLGLHDLRPANKPAHGVGEQKVAVQIRRVSIRSNDLGPVVEVKWLKLPAGMRTRGRPPCMSATPGAGQGTSKPCSHWSLTMNAPY